MNPYKKIVWMLRLLISSIFLVVLALVILPFILFVTQRPSDLQVSFSGVEQAPTGVRWILNHEKIVSSELDHTDLLYISTVKALEATIMKSVDHNQVVFEMLLSQLDRGSHNLSVLENMLHVEYTGFVGKSFVDLSDKTDVPAHLIELYETQEEKPWDFVGEGLVVFSNEKIAVLLEGLDYNGHVNVKDQVNEMPYYGYFEILKTDQKPSVVIDMSANETGTAKLAELALGTVYPAVIQNKTSLYQSTYIPLSIGNRPVDVPYRYSIMDVLMKNKIIYSPYNNEQVYWQWFVPLLQSLVKTDSYAQFEYERIVKEPLFVVSDHQIKKRQADGQFEPFFIKGINLGAALPGKTFTEFPQDKALYLQWFKDMKSLNFNAIRLYTLLPPVFYEALYAFNSGQEEPLYLMQEIWPEENPLEGNYLDAIYNDTYEAEIQMTIAAIHGDINIPERSYRAFGLYAYDVSPYVMAYLVGREMEPEEVKETNALNKGFSFKGDYFYTEPNASATEGWLASSCDYAYGVSEAYYGQKPLVAIVSWPTLDSLDHESEWNSEGDKSKQYNDSVVVDIGHIGIDEEKVSGFFGAYHIYPNYPDFMNLDPEYDAYQDDEGRFRYGGYLKTFMAQHTRYPAVVAEYGISTSGYTAHYSPDGLNHGGLSEAEQADGIIRMTKAIVQEDYSGAIIFEWMDEWAKKTWITEPYMIPYDRHVLWRNAMDPEQNYGLLKYQSSDPLYSDIPVNKSFTSGLESIRVGQNEAYLFIDLKYNDSTVVNQDFDLKVSTESELAGQDQWEFVLSVDETPEILVNPGYNWTSGNYRAIAADFSDYERLVQLTNKENTTEFGIYTPSQSQDLSQLGKGSFVIPQNQIQVKNNHVTLRLPYGLIGISDPSSRTILSDGVRRIPINRDSIQTKENKKIRYLLTINDQDFAFEQVLSTWETPVYSMQLKTGVKKIADFLKSFK